MWNISADAAFQWERNKINDLSVAEIYPLINLSVGFSPSRKHSFRTYFHFGANYPGASEKTPNVLQQNELMYYTGNPNLGLSRQVTFNLSYNWMPVNAFRLRRLCSISASSIFMYLFISHITAARPC